MKTKIPTFGTDKEAQGFVDQADLTDYDLSGGAPVQFNFEPKPTVRAPKPRGVTARDG